MPRIMTDVYRNASFIVPFSEDKTEYAVVKPLTDTDIEAIRNEAAKEGGADESLMHKFFLRRLLAASVTGWQGFYDVAGNELAFTPEMLREICECDPEFAAALAIRIRNVARMGELEERKN